VREGLWKSHEGRKQQQQPSHRYSTFFFSNFPGSHGEFDMFKIFQRWARMNEVFIARKFNRWGRRFDFVSFFRCGECSKVRDGVGPDLHR